MSKMPATHEGKKSFSIKVEETVNTTYSVVANDLPEAIAKFKKGQVSIESTEYVDQDEKSLVIRDDSEYEDFRSPTKDELRQAIVKMNAWRDRPAKSKS